MHRIIQLLCRGESHSPKWHSPELHSPKWHSPKWNSPELHSPKWYSRELHVHNNEMDNSDKAMEIMGVCNSPLRGTSNNIGAIVYVVTNKAN